MKKEYDFSKAEQGKFYRPTADLEIPIYLNEGKRKPEQSQKIYPVCLSGWLTSRKNASLRPPA